jgi:hypothetical protein
MNQAFVSSPAIYMKKQKVGTFKEESSHESLTRMLKSAEMRSKGIQKLE